MTDPVQVWEGDGLTPLPNYRTGVCRVCFDATPLRVTMCEVCKHSYADCTVCLGSGRTEDDDLCRGCAGQGFTYTVVHSEGITIPELG